MGRFARSGDAEAFAELMARSLPAALAVARRTLGDEASAEDAVQEAFLRVVRGRAGYAPPRPFANWFFTILRNVCTDLLRARARDERLAEAAVERAAADRPAAELTWPPDAADLLALLPAGDGDVLALRIVHGLSFREVAAALGISEEAAKKRAQRGLRRLRQAARLAEL